MAAKNPLNACCLALLVAASASKFDACRAQPVAGGTHSDGIWKAAVPFKPMNGEFESLDPIGLAAGARIKADCSLNWINPDDGKLYCFSSGTSLEVFLDQPQANLERARAGWHKMTVRRQ